MSYTHDAEPAREVGLCGYVKEVHEREGEGEGDCCAEAQGEEGGREGGEQEKDREVDEWVRGYVVAGRGREDVVDVCDGVGHRCKDCAVCSLHRCVFRQRGASGAFGGVVVLYSPPSTLPTKQPRSICLIFATRSSSLHSQRDFMPGGSPAGAGVPFARKQSPAKAGEHAPP